MGQINNMKLVLFDFDGVIANSHTAVINGYNQIAKLKKVSTISSEDFSNMSTKELLKHFRIRWFEIWYYVKLLRKILLVNIKKIHLEKEISEFFKHRFSDDIKFLILSSNSEKLITEFINEKVTEQRFTEIIGNVSVFNKHKKIKYIQRKYKLDNLQLIYVGDEVRDIIAAQKSGIQSIAVLWGKDNEQILLNSKPSYIARNGIDLVNIIKNFTNEY